MSNHRLFVLVITTSLLFGTELVSAGKSLRQRLSRAKQVGDHWIGTTVLRRGGGKMPPWNSFLLRRLPGGHAFRGKYLMDPTTDKRISPVYKEIGLKAGVLVATPFEFSYSGNDLLLDKGGAVLKSGVHVWEKAGVPILSTRKGEVIWNAGKKRVAGKVYRKIREVDGKLVGIDSKDLEDTRVAANKARPEDYVPVLDPKSGAEIGKMPLFNNARADKGRRTRAIKRGLSKKEAFLLVDEIAGEFSDDFPGFSEMTLHLKRTSRTTYQLMFAGERWYGQAKLRVGKPGHWCVDAGSASDRRDEEVYDLSDW